MISSTHTTDYQAFEASDPGTETPEALALPVGLTVPPMSAISASLAQPATEAVAAGSPPDTALVRRPTFGLVRAENRFAKLEVVAMDGGQPVQLLNTSDPSGRAAYTTNFLVQSVSEPMTSPAAMVESITSWYLSSSGQSPQQLDVQGVLFESRNFPWLSEWRLNFARYLSAGQCLKRRAQVFLTVDDTQYVGYVLQVGTSRSAAVAWGLVSFQFSMVLVDVVDLRARPLTQGQALVENDNTALEDGVAGPLRAQGLVRMPLEYVQGVALPSTDVADAGLDRAQPAPEYWTQQNLTRLLAVASAINRSANRPFFDLARLERQYRANEREALEPLRVVDPLGPATNGAPTPYDDEVAAKQRRYVQEAWEAAQSVGGKAWRGLKAVIE